MYLFREERNVIEAAAKGASTAISLVANVAAMLITFFAFIAFFNGVLSYLGSMVGYSELSFEVSWFKFSFHFVANLVEMALKISVMIMKVESKISNSYKLVLTVIFCLNLASVS